MSKNKIQIRNSTSDFLIFSKENGGDGIDVLSLQAVNLTKIQLFGISEQLPQTAKLTHKSTIICRQS